MPGARRSTRRASETLESRLISRDRHGRKRPSPARGHPPPTGGGRESFSSCERLSCAMLRKSGLPGSPTPRRMKTMVRARVRACLLCCAALAVPLMACKDKTAGTAPAQSAAPAAAAAPPPSVAAADPAPTDTTPAATATAAVAATATATAAVAFAPPPAQQVPVATPPPPPPPEVEPPRPPPSRHGLLGGGFPPLGWPPVRLGARPLGSSWPWRMGARTLERGPRGHVWIESRWR